MKAAVYYNNSDVRLEEKPKPEISSDEILVKVMASGICGTDVLEWYRLKKAPLVLGHEIAGEIAEVGKNVKRYKKGDRVFVSHHVPCDKCRYCLADHHTACETLHTTNYFPGGFSEYIRVPAINVEKGVFLLPKSMSFEEATFIEPLACVVRGQRVANFKSGQTVLILGSGISGLLHLLLARSVGAKKIIATDVNKYRLDKAKEFGADHVIDARKDVPLTLREVNDGALADLVIVSTGAFSAFKQALKSVDRGGTVLFFASTDPGADLSIPVNEFWRNEIKLMTSYANSPSDAKEAIELIKTHSVPVKKMITHRLPLAESARGFKIVAGAGESVKVIIEPHK
ncbi:zinc-dependent dehydrogenase [Candidatus Omnitrophota bacterium]